MYQWERNFTSYHINIMVGLFFIKPNFSWQGIFTDIIFILFWQANYYWTALSKNCEYDVRKSYLPRKIWLYIESNWDKMTQNHMSILFLGSFFRASVGVICFVNSFFFKGRNCIKLFLFHTTYHLIFSWTSKIIFQEINSHFSLKNHELKDINFLFKKKGY